ncbi:MAG TPA: hypothetical protein G4O02_08230 [Caldilineae bacterium]|jgi:hypothetical protein|nr:hypothetical protein [Caldilineae bacterium]
MADRVYFRICATLYHEKRDQIEIRFDRPRGREVTRIHANAVCEISPRGELVRVLVQDHKWLRLGKLLEGFDMVPQPETWSWGYITYDVAARTGTFYLTPWTPEDQLEPVPRQVTCEIDAEGNLVGIVIPVRGRDATWLLRVAARRIASSEHVKGGGRAKGISRSRTM